MKHKVRLGFIGSGNIAGMHAERLAKIEDAAMIAFSDTRRAAGQVCSCAERILVAKEIEENFVEAMGAETKKWITVIRGAKKSRWGRRITGRREQDDRPP